MSIELQKDAENGSFVAGGTQGRRDVPPIRFPMALKIGFWFCMAIAVAAVLRRAVALATPPNANTPAQLAGLDAYFAAHAALTSIHIFCALAFVLLLPFLFWRRSRGLLIVERAFLLLGLVVGGTAYAMSIHVAGGWLERSAVLFFNTLFLASLARAFHYARRGDFEQKQKWTLRAIAILLGIATTRPVMGIFFATSPLTGLTPQQFFGIAFWIGFSFNTLVIELWLRSRSLSAERIHS
jgi:hypothetical protein